MEREFRPIPKFGELVGIPPSSGIAGNSEEFRLDQVPGIPGIDGTPSVTSLSVILNDDRVPGIGWNGLRGRN